MALYPVTCSPEVMLLNTRLRKEPEDMMGKGFPRPQKVPSLLVGLSLTVKESITSQLENEDVRLGFG